MKKRLNKKGFTLIELLAVIVILGILIAISVPAVSTILKNARQNTMESELAYAVEAVQTFRNAYNVTGEETYTLSSDDHKKFTWTPANSVVIGGTAIAGSTGYSDILNKAMAKSPFGKNYVNVTVTINSSDAYTACADDGANSVHYSNGVATYDSTFLACS